MGNYWQKNILNNHVAVAFGLVLLALILWEIKSIIISLFVAYILMAALTPAVNQLVTWKVRRTLAVSLVFLLLLLVLLVIIAPTVPFVKTQTASLIETFPYYLERIGGSEVADLVKAEIGFFGKNIIFLTTKAFSGLFSLVTVIVVSFYLLLYERRFTRPTVVKINAKLGSWVRGQILLCLSIGVLTFIGLVILNVPFALPLAIIAGLLEIVPIMGPIISAIPALIIALAISPSLAAMVVGMYVLVQLLENNFLVPKIMQEAVGLNPIVIIVGIMIGGNLLGIMGAILSIPIILVLSVIRQNLIPRP